MIFKKFDKKSIAARVLKCLKTAGINRNKISVDVEGRDIMVTIKDMVKGSDYATINKVAERYTKMEREVGTNRPKRGGAGRVCVNVSFDPWVHAAYAMTIA